MKRFNQTASQVAVVFALILSLVQPSVSVFAGQSKPDRVADAQEGHGGDLGCDAKIQGISANLRGWIREQGARKGPLDLSSSLNPDTAKHYTFSEYETAMLALLEPYLVKPRSSCAPGPIEVRDADKICKSWMAQDGIHILCDIDRFPRLSKDEQVQQTHHEFANQVAGLEPGDGPISTYKISVQLSGAMANVIERKLVAQSFKPRVGASSSFVSIPLNNYCGSDIPAGSGCFWMGAPMGEVVSWVSEWLHTVVLSNAFEMGTTEVTQKQWFEVMGNNPSSLCSKEACPLTHQLVRNPEGTLTCLCPQNPVENVSWDIVRDTDGKTKNVSVVEFLQKLNARNDGYRYSLPTEAQWEYSARAGTSTAYYWGGNPALSGAQAWSKENSELRTHEVAQKGANAFGLYDTSGNVSEWVLDWYAADYSLAPGCQVADNPMGPLAGPGRVVRGGAWYDAVRYLRSAARGYGAASFRNYGLGFRLTRTAL